MEINNVNNYENDSNFMKNMLMSIMFTALVSFISYPVVYLIIKLLFVKYMTPTQSHSYAIISFCIAIIFTLFMCTFAIIDEIRKLNKKTL
jgi:fumarate reductase subunit D